jgi:hypothetical protein
MFAIRNFCQFVRRYWPTSFVGDRKGGVAVVAALSLPLLAGVAGVAVDLSRISMTKASLQSIADHLALAGARELQLRQRDISGLSAYLDARGQEFLAQKGLDARITARIDMQERSVKVDIEGFPQTLFVASLHSASTGISVQAVALSVGGEYPLCLVTLNSDAQHSMEFGTRSSVDARGCAFYANSSSQRAVHIQGNATLEASLICSAGGIATNGSFTTNAHREEDCPPLADPLRSRTFPDPGPCLMEGNTRITTQQILEPGTYCGSVELRSGADVELRPGIYVFTGDLRLSKGARLTGREVNLHFHSSGARNGTVFEIGREAHVSLTAPRHGTMAGMLLTGIHPEGGHQQYNFGTADAPELTGTIYLPHGVFTVESGVRIAERSPFTIIVTRDFKLGAGPELSFEHDGGGIVLNTDYHLSDIPIPPGLGPNGGSIVLAR